MIGDECSNVHMLISCVDNSFRSRPTKQVDRGQRSKKWTVGESARRLPVALFSILIFGCSLLPFSRVSIKNYPFLILSESQKMGLGSISFCAELIQNNNFGISLSARFLFENLLIKISFVSEFGDESGIIFGFMSFCKVRHRMYIMCTALK